MDVSWDAILSNFLLFLLIFGLSATVNFENLKRQIKNKQAFATGLGIQYVFMPLMGFLVVKAFTSWNDNFTPAMGLVLLVVTSSPGGSLSNWWCSTFNAELALSVAFSAVSSVASIALLPANVFLYTLLVYRNRNLTAEETNDSLTGANANANATMSDNNSETQDQSDILQSLDFLTIFVTLGIALAAVALGITAGYYRNTPRFHLVAHGLGSVSGIILIAFSLFLTSGTKGDDTAWYSQHWSLFVATILPCCAGIVASHLLARSMQLTPPETVAITIECCYQNTGIALSVAITLFDDPVQRAQAVAVPLVYGMADAVLVGLYCLYAWKAGWTKAPASEHICVVMTKSYEIEHESDHPNDTVAIKEQETSNEIEDDLEKVTGSPSTMECCSSTPDHDVDQSVDVDDGHVSDAEFIDNRSRDVGNSVSASSCETNKDDTAEIANPVSACPCETNKDDTAEMASDAESQKEQVAAMAVIDERECSALELCGSWSTNDATTTTGNGVQHSR